jgi:hypothetical protein
MASWLRTNRRDHRLGNIMTRTTLGILAGIVGSAIGALWWRRHRTQSVVPGITTFRETAEVTSEYSRQAEGIV